MSKWIKIEEKYPRYGQIVLLRLSGVVQEVTFKFDGDDYSDWFEMHENDSGHDLIIVGGPSGKIAWQPLPEAS